MLTYAALRQANQVFEGEFDREVSFLGTHLLIPYADV
jgi:hypothetical protein